MFEKTTLLAIFFSNPFYASTSLLITDNGHQDDANPFTPDAVAANPFLSQTPLQPQQQMHNGDSDNKGFSFNSDEPLTPLNDVTNLSSTSAAKQKQPRQSFQPAGNNNVEVRNVLNEKMQNLSLSIIHGFRYRVQLLIGIEFIIGQFLAPIMRLVRLWTDNETLVYRFFMDTLQSIQIIVDYYKYNSYGIHTLIYRRELLMLNFVLPPTVLRYLHTT